MVQIHQERCIGCGLCAKDCIAANIQITEGKAHVLGECLACGHCVAICPQYACLLYTSLCNKHINASLCESDTGCCKTKMWMAVKPGKRVGIKDKRNAPCKYKVRNVLVCSLNLTGTQAACAYINSLWCTVHNNSYFLNVWHPFLFCSDMGVADLHTCCLLYTSILSRKIWIWFCWMWCCPMCPVMIFADT